MEENKLIKFLNGGCSPKEEQEVLAWLNEPGAKKKFDLILKKYFDDPRPIQEDTTDYETMLNRIHAKVLKPEKRKNRKTKQLIIKNLRIAASLLLFLFSGYMLIEGMRYQKDPLESSESFITTTSRITGAGEKLTLLMPDKTTITVNALSEITFTSEYGKEERMVTVKGEAYFEIAPDADRPFRVKTNSITTTALGTAFNVYAREEQIRIALTEGKVSVNSEKEEIRLVPGQMAVWNPAKFPHMDFAVEDFDQEIIAAWKEGKLIFDREPLGEILNDLSLWYGVDMQIEKGLNTNRKVIGTFTNKNLKDILTGLGFSIGFDFVIQEKNVLIKKQKPME